MFFPYKYQDNQSAEPVKTKTNPYNTLKEKLFEEILTKEKLLEKKLIFENPLPKNGEYFLKIRNHSNIYM